MPEGIAKRRRTGKLGRRMGVSEIGSRLNFRTTSRIPCL